MQALRYHEWRPRRELAPWVRCFWLLEQGGTPAGPERVLPDGTVEWVLHYGARFRERQCDGGWRLQPRSVMVQGQHRFLLIEPTGPAGMIGVRFEPGAVSRFLSAPLEALDRTQSLTDLFGHHGRELEQRLVAARAEDARIRAVERFLLHRLSRQSAGLTGPVEAVLQAIHRQRGQVAIAVVAREYGISLRTLERRFRRRVGVTPKTLCRIERFQHVLDWLPRVERDGWAAVARRTGFADQAHLSRDFRSIAGISPEAYRNEQHAFSDAFLREPDAGDLSLSFKTARR